MCCCKCPYIWRIWDICNRLSSSRMLLHKSNGVHWDPSNLWCADLHSNAIWTSPSGWDSSMQDSTILRSYCVLYFEKFYSNGLNKVSTFPSVVPNFQVSLPGGSAGTKLRSCSQPALLWALFQHVARGSIHSVTTFYALVLWGYLNPSRHPYCLLPSYKLSSSGLFWNHIQVAPNFNILYTMATIMCMRENPTPLWFHERLMDFWAAMNVQCYRGRSWAAASLQVFLQEGMRIWEYRTFGGRITCPTLGL